VTVEGDLAIHALGLPPGSAYVVVVVHKAMVALMIALLAAGALSRPSLAQDASQPQKDRIIIPQGETELRFDNIERVPRQLLAAIRHTRCRVEDPVRH
jgi:hypothetical protein